MYACMYAYNSICFTHTSAHLCMYVYALCIMSCMQALTCVLGRMYNFAHTFMLVSYVQVHTYVVCLLHNCTYMCTYDDKFIYVCMKKQTCGSTCLWLYVGACTQFLLPFYLCITSLKMHMHVPTCWKHTCTCNTSKKTQIHNHRESVLSTRTKE